VAKIPDLGSLLTKKGVATGIEPAAAVGSPEPQPTEAPNQPEPAERAGQGAEFHPVTQPQTAVAVRPPMDMADRQLTITRRASGRVPTRNIQTRLPENLAEELSAMAFAERRSQQDIVAEAITEAITRWRAGGLS
jgi:hypothetical protein